MEFNNISIDRRMKEKIDCKISKMRLATQIYEVLR